MEEYRVEIKLINVSDDEDSYFHSFYVVGEDIEAAIERIRNHPDLV